LNAEPERGPIAPWAKRRAAVREQSERYGHLHPFVALMRRYCIDYTNSHDLSICDSIMSADYTLHMGAHVLRGRDNAYKPAVEKQFRQFPTLGLVVHEIVTNGTRLAMRFSEHGASARFGGRLACWQGIALYKWDGNVLVENWVEQDYLARREQLDSGVPHPLEAPALDPWVTQPAETVQATEQLLSTWLCGVGFANWAASARAGSSGPAVVIEDVIVDDIFAAGERAAFHVTARGRYSGGFKELDHRQGDPVDLYASGIATVAADGQLDVNIVHDGLGIWKSLS
jgi:hypothetical protein